MTCRHVSLIHHRFMFFRHSPPIGCYNISDRAMSIYVKNSQSLLEYPKKKLGSTPPLSLKITVQWFYFDHKNFNRKSIGHYNVNARANSIFGKNCESFLETPKKKLGSTPPLSVEITVEWFYFYHKNFNRKLIGCYNVNARAMSIFWKNCESFLEPPKKNLGSTPLLLVKITVQWFYFHHKNFNRKSIGH